MVVDQALESRESKLFKESSEDKEELKKKLTTRLADGETFFDMEELKNLGLIDGVTTPDAYLSETLFKGKKYKIGVVKSNIWKKLAAGKGAYVSGEGIPGFLRETIFADVDIETRSPSCIYNEMLEEMIHPSLSRPLLLSAQA